MKKKLYVVGGNVGYANWLQDMGMELCYNRNEANIALFTGGADWQPHLYGEKVGRYTSSYPQRDSMELLAYEYFLGKGIPMIGTCRGGQLFTFKAGGRLVQDSSHPHHHPMITSDGEKMQINSLHHQQFLLEGCSSHILLGWSERLSPYHLDGNNIDYNFPADYKEPELVYFKETKCLAIQCHPEMLGECRALTYFKECVSKYILQEEPKKKTEFVY